MKRAWLLFGALCVLGACNKERDCKEKCNEMQAHAVAGCVGPGAEICKDAANKAVSSCMLGCKQQ